jgi:hypothetical protein
VNPESGELPPFRVVYSGRCREAAAKLLRRAKELNRYDEIAEAIRGIQKRLEWIPLDFGEPLHDYADLGIKELIGSVAPLVVKYGVDEARRIVYVVLPLSLLPKDRF